MDTHNAHVYTKVDRLTRPLRIARLTRGMEISSSVPWDVDDAIEEALARQGDRPLKIRFAPTIWDSQKGTYAGWRKVAWGVHIRTLAEAQQLRTGLQLFFRAAATFGMGGLVEKLQEMLREQPAPQLAPEPDDE